MLPSKQPGKISNKESQYGIIINSIHNNKQNSKYCIS